MEPPKLIFTNISVSDLGGGGGGGGGKAKKKSPRYMQQFESYIPMSFEHEKSKNNMNLTKFRPWLTEMDCFIFPGR